jgi:hypothetical protein
MKLQPIESNTVARNLPPKWASTQEEVWGTGGFLGEETGKKDEKQGIGIRE